MRIILYGFGLVVMLVIVLGMFGESPRDAPNAPSVNWTKYASYKKIGIEKSIEEKSCAGLQRAFDAADGSELLNFIDWHLNNLGCYK